MSKILVNGKFFAQRITGVQRFARELLNALDKITSEGDLLLVVPVDAVDVPHYQKIKILRTNTSASIFFDQVKIPLLSRNLGIPALHLCHVGPILKPDYVIVHDVNVEINPQWFTKKLVIWYRLIHWACSKWAKKIFTVSNFSKNELERVYNIPQQRIVNIGNGWQHIEEIKTDENALVKYGLSKKKFYFSLGTKAPHKNLNWVFDYAQKHPTETFAISGSSYGRIFGKVDAPVPSNVHFLGYLSDSEMKSLMQNSKAFLFPSFYEGFGIPPLEAISTGCPVIVSDIPVMHEIFGESAHYINPFNTDVDLDELLKQPISSAIPVLEKYSWQKSAEMLFTALKDCIK